MIRLQVTAPADGGQCVGRHEGRVVFVRGALPGETVDVEITDEAARFWRGRVVEVVEPSPHRQQSACPWFGSCGGCSWLHTDVTEQLWLKGYVVRQTLRRLGGLDWPVEVRSLGEPYGWRTRVTLQVDDRGQAGFHAQGSNDVVGVEHCLQAAGELALDEILAQTWPGASRVHVSLSEAGRSVVAGEQRFGPAEHRHTVLGRTFLRAVDGFWQAHREAPTTLAGAVRALADPADRVVDLYSGVGLLGLSVLDAMPGARMTLVEGDAVAAGFARGNARGRARVLPVDARRWRPEPTDLVILDPPRAGAGRQVVASIVKSAPASVIYVSCDAATLARDIRFFSAVGYAPDHIEAFDLFPGTAHVEVVTRLRRTG